MAEWENVMRARAVDQVRQAGRRGLVIPIGLESVTLMRLVEDGEIYQEIADGGHYRFTHPDIVDRKRSKKS